MPSRTFPIPTLGRIRASRCDVPDAGAATTAMATATVAMVLGQRLVVVESVRLRVDIWSPDLWRVNRGLNLKAVN
jgi:hypothetical protein